MLHLALVLNGTVEMEEVAVLVMAVIVGWGL